MPLAEPTLTIADNADGTGAVATIAGGNASATNTVRTLSWTGDLVNGSWVSAGSRTGDGTVDLDLDTGYYFGRCDSTLSGEAVVSNLPAFRVTDEDEAIHKRFWDAAHARACLLTLADPDLPGGRLPASQIVQQSVLHAEVLSFPCVVIAFTEMEQIQFGTAPRDDVKYPLVVAILDREARNRSEPMPKYLKWREQLIRAFVNQRVGVAEIHTCEVQPQYVLAPDAPAYQHLESAFVVWGVARQTRGLT